jgi:protein-S-isoprenylcysteine O-methyltransferase Ste14
MNPVKQLILSTIRSLLIGVIVFGVLIFLPAGTLNYWQAWVFIAVFLGSANATGVYLSIYDPELLERRKHIGPSAEQSIAQKIIIVLSIIGSFALLAFCGLDHRFGWSFVPSYVSFVGDALILLGFYINFIVFKENRYGASSIRVFEGQQVISTGPYALVRHPMYAGVLVTMLGIPFALGSWWGLAFLALIVPVLIWRILDEEKLLKNELPGYAEYTHKVRYRLVPRVW